MTPESSPISWKSRKQPTVALSSCEAEYMALTEAVKEAKFLKQLLATMRGNYGECTTLLCDNQGAIALASNRVLHQRSKHIDIKYHFIRSEVENGSIDVKYVPSNSNLADTFTKYVNKVKLREACGQLMTS